MKKKLIQFKNIVKSYEDGKVVLKGIDLDIYENEFVTLLGPSGCGKSTLLRQLKTVLAPHGRENNAFAYFGRLFAGRSGRGAV